jgi:hypothetical protein
MFWANGVGQRRASPCPRCAHDCTRICRVFGSWSSRRHLRSGHHVLTPRVQSRRVRRRRDVSFRNCESRQRRNRLRRLDLRRRKLLCVRLRQRLRARLPRDRAVSVRRLLRSHDDYAGPRRKFRRHLSASDVATTERRMSRRRRQRRIFVVEGCRKINARSSCGLRRSSACRSRSERFIMCWRFFRRRRATRLQRRGISFSPLSIFSSAPFSRCVRAG